jgi:hypothetical protein
VIQPFLLLGGLSALVYGLFLHRTNVWEEREEQARVLVPTPFSFLLPPQDVSPDASASPEESTTRERPTEVEAPSPFESMSAEKRSPFDRPGERSPFDSAEDGEEKSPLGKSADERSPFDAPAPGAEPSPFEPGEGVEAQSPFEVSSTEKTPFDGSIEEEDEHSSDSWWEDNSPLRLDVPEPQYKTVTRIMLVSRLEPETVLVREVTYGGLMRRDDGKLMRTYSGTPPSLCPT